MSYRVEVSVSNRAGCVTSHCKSNNVKIQKGEIRQGVLVEINEHQSWKWRHWGCVTPLVVKNWKEKAEGDMNLVDGYEELPEEFKEKVARTFEQGHVDDEDWNGDVELNRLNPAEPKLPMFIKDISAAAKKRLAKNGVHFGEPDNEDGDSSDTKPSKKRSRTEVGEDKDDAKAPPAKKKARGKKAAEAEDSEVDGEVPDVQAKPKAKKARSEAEAKPAKKPRARKAKAEPVSDEADTDHEANEEPKPVAAKKSKAIKKAPAKQASVEPAEDEDEEKKPVATKKSKAKATKKAPVKQASSEPDEDQEEAASAPPPKAKANGKKKKAAGK